MFRVLTMRWTGKYKFALNYKWMKCKFYRFIGESLKMISLLRVMTFVPVVMIQVSLNALWWRFHSDDESAWNNSFLRLRRLSAETLTSTDDISMCAVASLPTGMKAFLFPHCDTSICGIVLIWHVQKYVDTGAWCNTCQSFLYKSVLHSDLVSSCSDLLVFIGDWLWFLDPPGWDPLV